MQHDILRKQRKTLVVGSGLIALDVMLNERRDEGPKLWTGGTCGNVLAILAYLGWHAVPVARLGSDPASRLIRRDLNRWGVDLRFINTSPVASAPIIIHKLRRTMRGKNSHSFSLHCPECGRKLPTYRAITETTAKSVASQMSDIQVFFADRVSRGVLTIAKLLRDKGAIVVFEPSSIDEKRLFQEMLSVTDILKYSQERLSELEVPRTPSVQLEVQTLGQGGLRYRSHPGAGGRDWFRVKAFEIDRFRDTAGAGDWCTAGLIHALAVGGREALKRVGQKRLAKAASFAQALAAWNCGFEGARAGMYQTNNLVFRKQIEGILDAGTHVVVLGDNDIVKSNRYVARVCAACRSTKRPLFERIHGSGG